jgi:hypothetical protein
LRRPARADGSTPSLAGDRDLPMKDAYRARLAETLANAAGPGRDEPGPEPA